MHDDLPLDQCFFPLVHFVAVSILTSTLHTLMFSVHLSSVAPLVITQAFSHIEVCEINI